MTLSRLSLILILAAAVFSPQLPAYSRTGDKISDMGAALQYCRESELEGPEGIWEFTDDETSVLIKKDPLGGKGYEIIVITTPDCRLHPGDIIGHIIPSAKKGKYKLNLNTSRKMGILTDTHQCMAEYIEKDDAIIVHPMKLKISMRTMWFLPKFWRSLRISFDNPAAELPHGLTRIYPRKEPIKPIYL